MNIIKVVRGNDFKLNLFVSKYDQEQEKVIPYDMSDAVDVVIRLIGNNGFTKIIKDAVPNGFKVEANIDGRMRDGKYGIELLFKINNLDKRIYQANKIEVVNCNCQGINGEQTTDPCPTFDMTMSLGADIEEINFGTGTYDGNVDSVLSLTSTNPVMNKTITAKVNEITEALIADASAQHNLTILATKTAEGLINTSVEAHSAYVNAKNIEDILLPTKQDNLISGTNIKTINNQSLLGSGNITIEEIVPDLTPYAKIIDVDSSLSGKANTQHKHTLSDITDYVAPDLTNYATKSDMNSKQDNLVSGTNIKTINGQSLLGSGNINISGGSGGTDYTAGKGIDISGNVISSALWGPGKGKGSIVKLSDTYENNSGDYSECFGGSNYAYNKYEHAVGYYNVSHKVSDEFGDAGNTLFSVGNGEMLPHNAFEIMQNGDIYFTYNGDWNNIKLQDKLVQLDAKQEALVSGTNIKTINGQSILGSGNITIEGGSSSGYQIVKLTQAEYDALETKDPDTLYAITD